MRYQRQRGSAIIFGISILALLAAMASAIDIGRFYYAQRSLQTQANLAALDATREIGGCRGPVNNPQIAATNAASTAIAANGGDSEILNNQGSQVLLGEVSTVGGIRQFATTAAEDASAVNVVLSRPAPARLLPMFGSAPVTLQAAAAAYSSPIAALRVGSSLATIDTTSSPVLNAILGGLLGTNLNLSVASYQQLLGTDLTLLDLAEVGLGAGSIGDFLNTELTVVEFLQGLSAAISGIDGVAAGIVDQIANLADPALTVLPGELFLVEEGVEALVGALPLNTLDLLRNLALIAGNGEAIDVPIGLSMPGLLTANVQLKAINPPAYIIGRPGYDSNGDPRAGTAYNSQVLVQLNLELGLPAALSALISGDVALHLYLKAAQASAVMESMSCASYDQPEHTLTVGADTDIATLGLGVYDDIDSSNPQPLPSPPVLEGSILGLVEVIVPITAGPVDVGSNGYASYDFDGPFVPELAVPSEENTRTVGTELGGAISNALIDLISTLSIDQPVLDVAGLSLLELLLVQPTINLLQPIIVSVLTALVAPLLQALDGLLLTPLFELLGLSLGNAEITVMQVQISPEDPFGAGNRPYVELVTH